MARFLVSYDLNDPPKSPDYHPLIKRIKEWGGQKVLYSDWLIRRDNTSTSQIYNDLKVHVDANDSLLVVALTGEATWGQGTLKLDDPEVQRLLAA